LKSGKIFNVQFSIFNEHIIRKPDCRPCFAEAPQRRSSRFANSQIFNSHNMIPATFDYQKVKTVDEALAALMMEVRSFWLEDIA
jgi:hypothetical protein